MTTTRTQKMRTKTTSVSASGGANGKRRKGSSANSRKRNADVASKTAKNLMSGATRWSNAAHPFIKLLLTSSRNNCSSQFNMRLVKDDEYYKQLFKVHPDKFVALQEKKIREK